MASKLPVIKGHVPHWLKEDFAQKAADERLSESKLLRIIVMRYLREERTKKDEQK